MCVSAGIPGYFIRPLQTRLCKNTSKEGGHQDEQHGHPVNARLITTRDLIMLGGRKHRGASPEAASAGQIKPGGANWAREEAGAGPNLGLSPLVSFIHPCIYFQT